MLRNHAVRLTGARARAMFVGALLTACLAALCVASPASATPKGEYAVFAECPVTTAELCLYAQTESGEFTVGKKTVPIEKTITLQGGLNEGAGGVFTLVGAKNPNNTLTKVPQKVPGGLLGLVECNKIKGSGLLEKAARAACEAVFENGLTGVWATTELAGPASGVTVNLGNLLAAEGTALQLPAKVHLENPLLGSSCYIGSNASPVILPLTTGKTSPPPPNKSISGKVGELLFNEEGTIITIKSNSLVNNSFAAPKTNGCGGIFEFLIGPIINSSLGVPSAAGTNTAILNGTLRQTSSNAVVESE